MLRCPITLTLEDDIYLVTSPDFAELKTFGSDEIDAVAHAADAVVTVIAGRIAERQLVPSPSTITGPAAIPSTSDALETALYQAMISDGISKAELGHRLGCRPLQVDRLLDLLHASRLDDLEAALHADGRAVTIVVDKAA